MSTKIEGSDGDPLEALRAEYRAANGHEGVQVTLSLDAARILLADADDARLYRRQLKAAYRLHRAGAKPAEIVRHLFGPKNTGRPRKLSRQDRSNAAGRYLFLTRQLTVAWESDEAARWRIEPTAEMDPAAAIEQVAKELGLSTRKAWEELFEYRRLLSEGKAYGAVFPATFVMTAKPA